MVRIIVNEGEGARPTELTAERTRVGSSPDCDIVLRHPSTAGIEFEIRRTGTGHCVISLAGDLFLNQVPCEIADLLHNDTLRAGESMVLYKNPDARPAEQPAAQPAEVAQEAPESALETVEVAGAGPVAAELLEELGELDELDELEEVEAMDELDESAELEGFHEPEAEAVGGPDETGELQEPTSRDETPEPPGVPTTPDADGDDILLLDDEDDENAEADERVVRTSPPARTGFGDLPVRFRTPLPPGHKAPAAPPPSHPGRPPQ